ncbi:MAG: ComF family protein [Anaerolineae bacterium]|nr:MAG: ComF family protein [Anaerolineae bacterium]
MQHHEAHWLFRVYAYIWDGVDWLFPPTCGGCNRAGYRWCPSCADETHPLTGPLCEICGIPLPSPGLCTACKRERPAFRALRSWSAFQGPLRNAILLMKYRFDLGLVCALTEAMLPFLNALPWPVDLVIPVPLSERRYKERGYNQAELIARSLALARGWECRPETLVRARDTLSQVGLSAKERRENVRGAFRADEAHVRGRSVLLVDDVATTGATLSACAQALLDGGATEVYALTLARALPAHIPGHPLHDFEPHSTTPIKEV